MAPGMTYANLATPGLIEERLGGASGGAGYINAAALTTIPVIGATPWSCGNGRHGLGELRHRSDSGAGEFNFDVTLAKSTRVGGIHENAVLQFRAEFFNLFNHPQFGSSGTQGVGFVGCNNNVATSTFGSITALSVNPRLMQLALKYAF